MSILFRCGLNLAFYCKKRFKMEESVQLVEYEKRAKCIRKNILDLAFKYDDGHIAPSYSCVEILVALYHKIMGEDDKFILSKGHACLALYAILQSKGFNPKISGHPDIEECEGISCTTGSLGHGLPIGLGMAFARKIQNKLGKIFVLLGDGECQEGTTWESMNLINRFSINNLVVIVDNNKFQALDSIKIIMNEISLKAKFEAFGTNVIEVNGHSFEELFDAFNHCEGNSKPCVIIANTIKGKGLSFMENIPKWHSRLPQGDELNKAYEELK